MLHLSSQVHMHLSDGGVCPTCPIMTYFTMNWYHMHVAYLNQCCCIVESVDVVVFDVALKCEVMK